MGDQVAFVKMTPSVMRGLQYAVASLEFDATPEVRVELVGEDDAKLVRDPYPNEDLLAAARWIRYQLSSSSLD